jgi:hypothetical protein
MNIKTTPKDFFLNLAAAVALYAATIALVNLSLSIVDYVLPDALAGYFTANSIAWPISMLVVLVPLLYVFEWLIARDITKIPEKAELWVRKWRLYLTIFLMIALIGGDLITLINTYLNGEVTTRFIWKVLSILVIAGVIGKYYFFSVYTTFKWAPTIRKGNMYFGLVLVLAAIIAGFVVVGSPSKQRALRFDAQRVSDLSTVQWQIISYWQQKGKLPASLDMLNDPISNFTIPKDPDTVVSYEYASTTKYSFDLCATFFEKSQDGIGRGGSYPGMSYSTDVAYPTGGVSNSWTHAAGRVCFSRTIDPDKYPMLPAPSKSLPL